MIALSYARSPALEERLKEIDQLHRDILYTVLPSKAAQYLRWEAMIDRLYAIRPFVYPALTKKTIINILSHPRTRTINNKEDAVLAYKQAFDQITADWLVTAASISAETLSMFARMIGAGTLRGGAEVVQLLEYLGPSPEHPVISSGIVYLQMLRLNLFSAHTDCLAWLSAYIFLYRAGYHAGDMLVLESFPAGREKEWRHMVAEGKKNNNQTLWLEYFSSCVRDELQRIRNLVTAHHQDAVVGTPRFLWQLTDRQKEVLLLMDQPGVRMTNKKVQKGWKISPITASRELAKLTGMGLVYPHGNGRSVYYTRI